MNASEELQAADLAQQLAEARATIDALLSGQVDAVVDAASGTPVLLVKAQEALKQSEERFREQAALLDIAHDAIYVRDLDGYITYWNKGAEEAYGWTAKEAVGSRAIALLSTTPAEFQAAEAVLLQTGTWQGERTRRTNAGRDITMAVRWTLVRDAEGAPKCVLAINTNVTDRNEALETLRKTEERMRFALETANIGFWDLDCASGAVTWSATLEAQYGLKPGAFGGTFDAYVELIHPDDRASVLSAVEAAMRSGADYSVRSRALWADGTVQWLSGAGRFVMDEGGRAVRGAGISQNITERLALERQYQHAQKMEAIGLLASGVAHDFNNLLTVIHGFASLVAEDRALDERHASDLGEVIKAADRAAALTKQLLAFSRQQVLQTSPLDVNLLLRDMTGMLRRLIGEHIEISLVLEPGLSLALADRGQLEQVVMNLVVNARDAMPSGGLVTIETKDIEFDESLSRQEAVTPGLYVMVSISDTGSGMTEATKQHLFEPFFTTKESGKGTGLGLSTTYGIVKQSNGYIWVDSELGRGTTFRVYFPRADREATAEAVRPEVAAPLKRRSRTVLLVEDEGGLRMLVKRMLESEGFRVLDAANGDDAEMLFAEHADSIDLLLTDVVMPGCGGPELLTRLQGRSPALNVLYMSGYTEQSAAHRAGIDRGTPFLQKPFTAVELLRQVRRALPIDRSITHAHAPS